MNKYKILNKTAKILVIAYTIFLGLFALDMFDGSAPWYIMLGGFLIHLIPNFILIGIAIVAWRREKIGGIIFILLSIIFTVFFRTYTEFSTFLLISVPLFLIGLLFLLSSRYKKEFVVKDQK